MADNVDKFTVENQWEIPQIDATFPCEGTTVRFKMKYGTLRCSVWAMRFRCLGIRSRTMVWKSS